VVRSIQPDASLNISEARSIGHAGRGVVVRWGEENGTPVGSGDWVHVEPGEQHWHGALPDDVFVHLAVTASGQTQWHGPVSDADYRAGLPRG
jgi:hypothetical protein